MAESYTKQEFIELVNQTFPRCLGITRCKDYRSVHSDELYSVSDTLLEPTCAGCCRALELSWGEKYRWCTAQPAKQSEDAVNYVRSLTWANLRVATKDISR